MSRYALIPEVSHDLTNKATPMTKTTVSAAGGAMPANILSLNNLVDEETGRTNRDVLRALVHRRAIAELPSQAHPGTSR